MTANRIQILRQVIQMNTRFFVRHAWALWQQTVVVSKVKETMQVAQAERITDSKRMVEERQREELDARDVACASKLEAILTENQNLSMRAASLVAEVIAYRLQVQRLESRCLNAEREAKDAKQKVQEIADEHRMTQRVKDDQSEILLNANHSDCDDSNDELDTSSERTDRIDHQTSALTPYTKDQSFQWSASPLNQFSSSLRDATSSLVPPLPPGLTPHTKAKFDSFQPWQSSPVADLPPKRLLS